MSEKCVAFLLSLQMCTRSTDSSPGSSKAKLARSSFLLQLRLLVQQLLIHVSCSHAILAEVDLVAGGPRASPKNTACDSVAILSVRDWGRVGRQTALVVMGCLSAYRPLWKMFPKPEDAAGLLG